MASAVFPRASTPTCMSSPPALPHAPATNSNNATTDRVRIGRHHTRCHRRDTAPCNIPRSLSNYLVRERRFELAGLGRVEVLVALFELGNRARRVDARVTLAP